MKVESFERGLLFGILAFQNDFISREQLLTAVQAGTADKSVDIDERLTRQGAISDQERQFLNDLVDRYVARHGGEARQSLQQLSSIGSLKDDLAKLADTQLQATIDLVATQPPSSTVSGGAQESASGTRTGLRFRIRRQLDKGGLGVVSLAVDSELNREVALKQIRADRADDALYRSKFVLEAEITGGLEHPGIVPVYGLGLDDSGRPYYAMRLIRGDNLAAHIAAFHQERKTLRLTYDGMPLRRLLRRFLDICDAIAYAHARGVLHRDLKPGNVMLGKHGETLVVDWGLAKATGEKCDKDAVAGVGDTEDDEPPLQPSGSQPLATSYGSALGTAAYAPPEQLTGDIDQLGVTSDVYGLGAILYELLTGVAPARGKSLDEVIHMVTRGEIPPPRSIERAIPRALDAICLRAMAFRPQDRYADASALRREVERWLDDQPIEALPDRPWQTAWRWLRRHRDLAATGLLALVAITLVSSAAVVLVDQARRRADALAYQKTQLAEKELAARRSADEQRNEALRRRAESEAVTEFLKNMFRQVNPGEGSRTITVADTLGGARKSADREFADRPLIKSAVFDALATAFYGIGDYRAARELYQEALELDEEHLGPADTETLTARSSLAACLYQLGELDEAIALMRRSQQLAGDDFDPHHLNNLAEMEVTKGNLDVAESLFRESIEKLDAAPERDPELRAMIDLNLARVLLVRGELEQAVERFQSAYERLCSLFNEEHPNALIAASNLAVALARVGREEESAELAQRVISIKERVLGPAHPDTLASKNNLAMSHIRARNFDAAIPLLEDVHAGMPSFTEPTDPRRLGIARLLADLYLSRDQFDKALPLFQEILQTYDEHAIPVDATCAQALAGAHRCLMAQGQAAQSLGQLLDSIPKVAEALGEDSAIVLQLKLSIAAAHRELGETDKSLAAIQEVVAAAEKLPAAIEILWQARMEQGETWLKAKDGERAKEAFQEAQEILNQNADDSPAWDSKRTQTAAGLEKAEAMLIDPADKPPA